MIKKIVASSILAMAAVSAPALAQDAGVAFDGPYIAAMGGYDKVRVDTPLGHGSDDGVLFGGVVGFDKNINGAVIGIEGEYSDSNTKESVRNLLSLNDRASFKTGRDLYAGVRIGGEVAQNVMLYAKGGYTNAKIKASYSDGIDTISGSDNLEGYRLGAGVETTVRGLVGRLEYRYSSYGHYADVLKPERHQVAAMVGYRF